MIERLPRSLGVSIVWFAIMSVAVGAGFVVLLYGVGPILERSDWLPRFGSTPETKAAFHDMVESIGKKARFLAVAAAVDEVGVGAGP